MPADFKPKSLSDKTIALVVLSVYIICILGFVKIAEPAVLKKHRLAEIVIALHSLCFFGFFICLPRKAAMIKGVILSVIVPYLCCMILYTTFHVTYILDWKLPLFLVSEQRISFFLLDLIANFGLVPYIMFGGWFVSLVLLVILGICTCLYRLQIGTLAVERTGIFIQKKFILLTGIIYIAFVTIYAFMLKVKWDGYFRQIFEHGAFIYIFSFFSILYAAPFITNNIKRIFLCCLIIPVFWPVFIGAIYTAAILVYTPAIMPDTSYSGMPFFSANTFTFHYFLVRYLDTQSWFISLPLLLVCYIYARWFASSKHLISEDGAQ